MLIAGPVVYTRTSYTRIIFIRVEELYTFIIDIYVYCGFKLKTCQNMIYHPSSTCPMKYGVILPRRKLDDNKGREMYKSRCSKSDLNSFTHMYQHVSESPDRYIIYPLYARRAKIPSHRNSAFRGNAFKFAQTERFVYMDRMRCVLIAQTFFTKCEKIDMNLWYSLKFKRFLIKFLRKWIVDYFCNLIL